MIVSKRIDWIFANSYIRKSALISKSNPHFAYAVIIFIYGAIKITQLYFLQTKHRFRNNRIPDHIVVESAAPHMHLNYFRYFNNRGQDDVGHLIVECFNKSQFTGIAKLSLISVFKEFYLTFKEVLPFLADLQKVLSRNGVIKEVMTSLPVFSYFVCLLKALKENNSNIKLFSGGAPLISSAAILLNIETYYLAHGFVNKPVQRDELTPESNDYFLAYPDYKYIYTYSEEEKKYLELFGISSLIKTYPCKKLAHLQRKVIIFLNYTDDNMDQNTLEDLIDISHRNDYEVIIKIHPTYMGNFDKSLPSREKVRFEDSPELSANSFIQKERPEFACGWISTTLCEALSLGVIPICLSDEGDQLFDEVLYPLKKKSIMWHAEKELIKSVMENKSYELGVIRERLASHS